MGIKKVKGLRCSACLNLLTILCHCEFWIWGVAVLPDTALCSSLNSFTFDLKSNPSDFYTLTGISLKSAARSSVDWRKGNMSKKLERALIQLLSIIIHLQQDLMFLRSAFVYVTSAFELGSYFGCRQHKEQR